MGEVPGFFLRLNTGGNGVKTETFFNELAIAVCCWQSFWCFFECQKSYKSARSSQVTEFGELYFDWLMPVYQEFGFCSLYQCHLCVAILDFCILYKE